VRPYLGKKKSQKRTGEVVQGLGPYYTKKKKKKKRKNPQDVYIFICKKLKRFIREL
jgi:hypothetical protein